MSLNEIQRAVEKLPQDDRCRLTAWMVSRYPLLTVEGLMARAAELVEAGQWDPSPPSDDNRAKGEMLDRALRIAEEHGLGK